MTDQTHSGIGEKKSPGRIRDTGFEDDVLDASDDYTDNVRSIQAKLTDRPSKIFEQAYHLAALNAANRISGIFNDYLPFCESEIEKTFLAAFVAEAQQDDELYFFPADEWRNDVHAFLEGNFEFYLGGAIHRHGPDPITMFMQVPIDEYRVDFLIYGVTAECDDRSTWGRVKLIVECDGHDFHEKTKQQAKRDKKRDRTLMAMGYHVMRFTGSEIWNDPRKVVQEALSFVRKVQSRHQAIRRTMS